ncbi:hypothetical protein PMIN02_008267 [Paraphaeosphaeria minitans]
MQSLCHSSAGNRASRQGAGAELSSTPTSSRATRTYRTTTSHCDRRRRAPYAQTHIQTATEAPTAAMSSRTTVLRLYRRSLKLALDWAVHRYLWRGQAMYIRSLFEANKTVAEPRRQRDLIKETENLLEKWKHPDPYRPPTAPGGSKYERNLPAPILDPPPKMTL